MNSKLKECHPGVSLWRTIGSMRLVCALVAFSAMMFFSACSNYQEEFDNNFGALEYVDDVDNSSSSGDDGVSSETTTASSSSMENPTASSSSGPASSGVEPLSSEAVPTQSSEESSSSSAQSSSSSILPYTPPSGPNYDTLDYNGQKYRTVKIGDQEWMAENMNAVVDGSTCYRDSSIYCDMYGRLYSWDAAMKVCPEGWRLPDTTDWSILFKSVGGKATAATHLKATTSWTKNGDGNGDDAFGFSAFAAGGSDTGSDVKYAGKGIDAAFWTSEVKNSYDAWGVGMYWADSHPKIEVHPLASNRRSVRCIKESNSSSSSSVASSSSVSSSSQSSSSEKTEKCYGKEYTPSTHFCDDRDGAIYRYFTTELVTWMAENLNYEMQESYCPEDETEKCEKYGRLYTWEAAKVACPSGWHLASSNEYGQLRYDVGNVANRLMSESWNGQDGIGFDALPAGYRYSSGSGYNNVGKRAYFWTSTEETSTTSNYMDIAYRESSAQYMIEIVLEGDRKEAYSVRCAKDR